jgi:hypothetical protein
MEYEDRVFSFLLLNTTVTHSSKTQFIYQKETNKHEIYTVIIKSKQITLNKFSV